MNTQFQFEPEFQLKVLALVARDSTVIPYWRGLLKPKYFTDTTASTLCTWVYDYWDHYRSLPTRVALRHMADSNPNLQKSEARLQLVHQWIDALCNVYLGDKDYILERVSDFCKTQEYTLATIQAAQVLQKGQDPAQIPYIIQEAQERLARGGGDIGLPLVSMTDEQRMEAIFSKPIRDCIETPWPTVNHWSQGPARKELWVWAAPTNYGKSWFLYNTASHAIQQGKLVIVYTLEMSRLLVALRVFSLLTNVPTKDIEKNPACINEYMGMLKQTGGELIVQEFHTATINDIRDHLTRVATQYNRKPDMIVIDYADLLVGKHEGDSQRGGRDAEEQERFRLAGIYKGLRRIAVEHELASVTASQTNKSTLGKEVITIGDLEEAFKKAHIADVIWALCQTKDEEQISQMRLVLAKNRNEKKGIVVPLNIDFTHGKFTESGGTSMAVPTDIVVGSAFQDIVDNRQLGGANALG